MVGSWGARGFYGSSVVLSLHGAVGSDDLCGELAAAGGFAIGGLGYSGCVGW